MDIVLCNTTSEKNVLEKTLINPLTLTGTLKSETSIVTPTILIEIGNPSTYNYAYIEEFNRYYYIVDMVSVRTDLWRLALKVDVLMSFKEYIKNCTGIVSDSSVNGADNYLMGKVWKNKTKEFTDIISFPSGLLTNGEFILITAGG